MGYSFSGAIADLVDNSISAGATRVYINLHALEGTAPPHIIVADNGKGIAQENINKVFEQYFTTREDGTGFGLTIAKKIIEDHEGFINIHSTEGLGTTVSVWIPVYDGSNNSWNK